ncbi:MAG: S1 RNA-binding domain-containing protein [Acholeplasmataceae bacterium]|nr:S1 RNA-binding domain-containing protein [Acholeplasmataceae bacterium]
MAENNHILETESFTLVKRGQKVQGRVFKVEKDVIYVTLENKQEARMYLNHFGEKLNSFKDVIKEGDVIEAIVSKIEENPDASFILLDRKGIIRQENFQKVKEIYQNEEVISVKVTKVDERGLHVRVLGFSAFLPYGLLDNEYIRNKNELKGKTLEVNVIEAKEGRRPRIIVSRKKIFEQKRIREREEKQRQREEEFDAIKTGDIITGVVERIERHMAIIRFEHVVGRLRISQISYSRIDDIKDVLKLKEEVTVKVIKKDKSLDLSIKALLPTPFESYVKDHKKGDTVVGEVVQKLPFGIIIELAENVRGLLHVSEYSWNPNDNFASFVKISDKVETKITLIDTKKEKISLSRRLLLDNPWKNVNFKRGEVVDCKVLEILENGLTVEAKGVNGFIPLNELKEERITSPRDYFGVGDKVTATVIEVNKKSWHLVLSIKKYLIESNKEEYQQYLTDKAEKTTLGDLFDDFLNDDDLEEDFDEGLEEDLDESLEEDFEEDLDESLEEDFEEDLDESLEDDLEELEEDFDEELEEDFDEELEEDLDEEVEEESQEELKE